MAIIYINVCSLYRSCTQCSKMNLLYISSISISQEYLLHVHVAGVSYAYQVILKAYNFVKTV